MDIAIAVLGVLVILVFWITLAVIIGGVAGQSKLRAFLVLSLGGWSSVVLYVLLLAKAGVIS